MDELESWRKALAGERASKPGLGSVAPSNFDSLGNFVREELQRKCSADKRAQEVWEHNLLASMRASGLLEVRQRVSLGGRAKLLWADLGASAWRPRHVGLAVGLILAVGLLVGRPWEADVGGDDSADLSQVRGAEGSLVIRHPNPSVLADQVSRVLTDHQIERRRVDASSGDVQIQARIPSDHAALAGLRSLGIEVPAHGRLNLRIVKANAGNAP